MSTAVAEEPPTRPDWDAIERDYRSGIKTLRQIASEHGISNVAVLKRARRDNWPRDLSKRIAASADREVAKAALDAAVSSSVSNAVSKIGLLTKRALTEEGIVEANANLQATTRLEHRKDVGRYRRLVSDLTAELEAISGGDATDIRKAVAAAMSGQSDEMRAAVTKLLRLPGRVDLTRKIVETFGRLVELERQAVGIKDDAPAPDELPKIVNVVYVQHAA